jgi:hypothetical protein
MNAIIPVTRKATIGMSELQSRTPLPGGPDDWSKMEGLQRTFLG